MSAATARDLLDPVWIVPALPLLGAALLLLLRQAHRRAEGGLDRVRPAAPLVRLVGRDVRRDAQPPRRRTGAGPQRLHLAPRGPLRVDIGFFADPLSVTWILLVTGVGSLIHLYAIGYMHGDPRFSRFFAYLNLFAASMLVLVLGAASW